MKWGKIAEKIHQGNWPGRLIYSTKIAHTGCLKLYKNVRNVEIKTEKPK